MSTLKRCTVVMLPTIKAQDDNAIIWKEHWEDGLLFHDLIPNKIRKRSETYCDCISYHLYITSDDEIKEGDWFINEINEVWQHNGKVQPYKGSKKIIATTDNSLICEQDRFLKSYKSMLPKPSQSFIEKYVKEYNKGNVITDVMINDKDWIGKNNTITIKKVKDSFSRDEVVKLLQWCGKHTYHNGNNLKPMWENKRTGTEKNILDKWIEENL